MPPGYQIRVAKPSDEAGVTDFLQLSYPVLMGSSYEETLLAVALPLMTRANPGLLESGTYYVAVGEGGRIVGSGGWTRERPGTGEIIEGLAHIRHFAVHPDWTRQGIARAIYDQCEAAARASGFGRFECYSSLNAEGFYAALRFKRIRPVVVPMGEGIEFPAILMERDI